MRCLVTGGAGFVGSNVVRRLLALGHEVSVNVRPTTDRSRLADVGRDVVYHEGSIVDPEFVSATVRETRPDWIFHLAVHGAYSFQTDIADIASTNATGTANLLRAATEVGCAALINTGSSAEYGDLDHAPAETEAARPNSYYAATKATATWLTTLAALEHSAPFLTLRLYSVYGPHEEERRLMPTLLRHALMNRWPPLASPATVRDFVYIDDVVDAYLQAAQHAGEHSGEIFNIGTGSETRLDELVALTRSVCRVDAEPVFGGHNGHRWDTRVWRCNPDHTGAILGWTATTSMADGVGRYAKWLGRNPVARA